MRAIKAPFKAIGRLFGGGRKNDSKKLARVTEKDLRKFESVPVQVVNDTRVSQKTTNDENRAPAVATNASD
jgi:hypothetical protein